MNDQMLKRTPLFDAHRKLGAKMIDFGGWEMPVQYSSIVVEHLAVRRNAGMFDISHMGEVLVSGNGAVGFLNRMLTNDINRLAIGEATAVSYGLHRTGTAECSLSALWIGIWTTADDRQIAEGCQRNRVELWKLHAK